MLLLIGIKGSTLSHQAHYTARYSQPSKTYWRKWAEYLPVPEYMLLHVGSFPARNLLCTVHIVLQLACPLYCKALLQKIPMHQHHEPDLERTSGTFHVSSTADLPQVCFAKCNPSIPCGHRLHTSCRYCTLGKAIA